MTYTETQLEAIRLFGRKDLSDGCYTLEKNGTMWHCGNGEWKKCYNSKGEWGLSSDYGEHMGEILGHIPHLFPDVAIGAKEKGFKIKTYYTNQGDYIVNVYGIIGKNLEDYEIMYNPTLPLLDQPNLSDIINLFK